MSNFTILLATYGRDPPQGYSWILGSKSGVFFQREISFETFAPIWSHVTEIQTKRKKMAKSIMSNFTILWTTFVEILPGSMYDFWGSESDAYFQRTCRLCFFFIPYGPMLTKTKKKKNVKKKHGLEI